MDLDRAFATGFLGAFALTFLIYQFVRLWQWLQRPVARWLTQHVTMPRIRKNRHYLNPSRAQILFIIVHWTVVGFYNIYQVHTAVQAAERAGRLSLLHAVLLMAPTHTFLMSYLFNASLSTTVFMHSMLGYMSVLQGLLHCLLHASDQGWTPSLNVFEITAVVALALLAMSPLVRSHLYEFFLQTHRAAAIALVAMLWVHIDPSQNLSWALLIAGTAFFGSTYVLQFVRQLYISMDGHLNIGKIQEVTEHGGSYMLEVKTARTWTIRPGTYVLFTVLNWRYASFLQRHPFMVAWYENWDDESSIYLIIRAQKGWTRSVNSLRDRKVWFDGPYGKPYDSGSSDLSECDTVLLIAEESGIFAHLLILKSLVEKLNYGCTKTRRVVFMWNTTGVYHENIHIWITRLVIDTNNHRSFLNLHTHVTSDEAKRNRRQTQTSTRSNLHFHRGNVKHYIDYVVDHPSSRKVAVIVSAGAETRELARTVVLGRKLSGLKNPDHNPESAYIGQTSDKGNDKPIQNTGLPQQNPQDEERLYELELHEHDFQPFDVR